MTTYYDVNSEQSLRVAQKDMAAFNEIAKTCLGDYHEDFFGSDLAQPTDPVIIDVQFNGEVGQSLQGRVQEFMKQAGPLLLEAVTLQVREDTPGDDRDEYVTGGPNQKAIVKEASRAALSRACNELSSISEKLRTQQLSDVLALGLAVSNDVLADMTLHDTPFGKFHFPSACSIVWRSEDTKMIACAQREDGDADVQGSLNLEQLGNMEAAQRAAKMQAFISLHRHCDVFAFVDNIPDVLVMAETDTKESPSNDTIAVFVVAENIQGETEILKVDVPTSSIQDMGDGEHIEEAKRLCNADGYRAVAAFDEYERAAEAINADGCYTITDEPKAPAP